MKVGKLADWKILKGVMMPGKSTYRSVLLVLLMNMLLCTSCQQTVVVRQAQPDKAAEQPSLPPATEPQMEGAKKAAPAATPEPAPLLSKEELDYAVEDAAYRALKSITTSGIVVRRIAFLGLKNDRTDLAEVFRTSMLSAPGVYEFYSRKDDDLSKLAAEIEFEERSIDLMDPATVTTLKQLKLKGVHALLYGSVRGTTVKEGTGTVRLALTLTDVTTGKYLWGSTVTGKYVPEPEVLDPPPALVKATIDACRQAGTTFGEATRGIEQANIYVLPLTGSKWRKLSGLVADEFVSKRRRKIRFLSEPSRPGNARLIEKIAEDVVHGPESLAGLQLAHITKQLDQLLSIRFDGAVGVTGVQATKNMVLTSELLFAECTGRTTTAMIAFRLRDLATKEIMWSEKVEGTPTRLSPFERVTRSFAKRLGERKIRIGIGDFLYSDTPFTSPCSARIRDDLAIALPAAAAITVVTRERLSELNKSDLFQLTKLVKPGSGLQPGKAESPAPAKIPGIDAIVRGRYYPASPFLKVVVKLVLLDSGEQWAAEASLDLGEPGTGIKETDVVPIRLKKAQKTASQAVDLAASVPSRDFAVNLWTRQAKTDYFEGEKIGFVVRSSRDSHVAIFCHQQDSSTVLLFPNEHAQNTLVKAGQLVHVPDPGKHEFEIEITEPFGADVVQAIACSDKTALQKLIVGRKALPNSPYCTIDRAEVAKGLRTMKAGGAWSESRVVVNTYPRR